jgi:hypothetical protein
VPEGWLVTLSGATEIVGEVDCVKVKNEKHPVAESIVVRPR